MREASPRHRDVELKVLSKRRFADILTAPHRLVRSRLYKCTLTLESDMGVLGAEVEQTSIHTKMFHTPYCICDTLNPGHFFQ